MAWTYERNESNNFEVIPEGRHRVRIFSAERCVSKNTGNDMIKLTLDVSGYNSHLFSYIVFLPDRPEITNRNLTQFFDSFTGITEGDCDVTHWEGAVGACTVKHEEYKGNTTAKVGYFIPAKRAKDLPAWKEPDNSVRHSNPGVQAEGAPEGFMTGSDELPPW